MTSPVRSVAVRLSMDPSSYIAGASRAEASTLQLDRAVSKVGGSATTSMEKAAKGAGTAESALGKLNKSAGALGLTMGGLAGAGGAIAVAMSIKWAGDYQSALTRLSTTAGESQANLKMVGQGMLDMAGQVGIGAQELAKGMYTVDSAGIHGADSLTVLKAAAQGARQENADLSHVVDAVTTSLHDYHLPASQAATVTSQLIAAVSHGKTTFDELTGAMHSVEPIAASAGMSIAQTAGALAAMTASGMHADQAAQNLASSIRSFEKPTSTMTAELAQLGLNSQDLSAQLGQKGIAGTLQEVSNAIVAHMGPAGQVALSALNQNKQAAQALATMIATMPPALQQLSQGLLAGTTSQIEFRKASVGLGGQAGAMADQFLSLYKSSDGFSSILKAGGPAVQTYIGALGKAVGTSEGLSVALQLTGENADGANKAIGAVAKAAADAHGNVQGWDEVQQTFNQRLAEAEQGMVSLATEAGQHLLPMLSSALGYVTRDGIPAIEHLGHGLGDVAHWFGELPVPVKTAAEAMAALKFAEMIGLTGKLGAGLAVVRTALAPFTSAAATSAGALAAVKNAGVGLMDLVGGPWVMGIGALTAAYVASSREIDNWAKGLEKGGREATIATQQLDDAHTRSILSATSVGDAWDITKGAFADGLSRVKGYSSALDEATRKSQDWYNHLSASQKIDENVTTATANLKEALAQYGSKSDQVKWATFEYNQALGDQKTAQEKLDIATRGTNGALQSRISLEQQLAQGGVSLDQATLTSKQAIDDYKKSLKDANLTEDARQQALDNVSQSIFGVMDAAKQQADLETTGLPKQMQTNQEIVRQRDALDGVINKLGFVPPALQGMYDSLNGPTAQALQATKTNIDNIGTGMTTVVNNDVPGMMKALSDLAAAAGSTFPQAVTGGFLPAAKGAGDAITQTGGLADVNGQKVSMFGQIISGLPPSHNTNITADTTQAQATIDAFLANVKAKGFVGAVFNVGGPVGSGAQTGGLIGVPPVRKATGGAISGPGTGTSDSVLIAASNGEHMWTAAETAAAGGHAGVEAIRRAVLGHGGGRAAGGPIYPVDWGKSVQDGWAASLARAIAIPGVPADVSGNVALGQALAAARGWTGLEWRSLYALWQRESGWRNTAQNPTSTAFGIPQLLDGTWAGTGYRKTSDPRTQILAGENYIEGRFGDPIGAWAHEQKFGWYHNGGLVTGAPGADVPAVLKVGETVRTADQEQTVQRQLRTREMPGAAFGGTVVQHTDARSYPLAVTAGPDTASIVRQVRDAQRDLEFLHG